jgi:hypothetical protein
MASLNAPIGPPPPAGFPLIQRLIKTECGRAKYAELAGRRGPLAWVRLAWFVLVAAIRDWPLPPPEQG